MASIPEVRFEGWVRKQGHFMPTWKKRYMVLEAYGVGLRQTAKISYYKTDKTDIPPQGSIYMHARIQMCIAKYFVHSLMYDCSIT